MEGAGLLRSGRVAPVRLAPDEGRAMTDDVEGPPDLPVLPGRQQARQRRGCQHPGGDLRLLRRRPGGDVGRGGCVMAGAKLVHFRVVRGENTDRGARAFSACNPVVSVSGYSKIKLHDAPAAVTCPACRESMEFQANVGGA